MADGPTKETLQREHGAARDYVSRKTGRGPESLTSEDRVRVANLSGAMNDALARTPRLPSGDIELPKETPTKPIAKPRSMRGGKR